MNLWPDKGLYPLARMKYCLFTDPFVWSSPSHRLLMDGLTHPMRGQRRSPGEDISYSYTVPPYYVEESSPLLNGSADWTWLVSFLPSSPRANSGSLLKAMFDLVLSRLPGRTFPQEVPSWGDGRCNPPWLMLELAVEIPLMVQNTSLTYSSMMTTTCLGAFLDRFVLIV